VEIFGIAILAAGLMGVWHVTRYAVPRTMRAVGKKRSASIQAWKAQHPNAPAVTRWPAAIARAIAAFRWGPRFLIEETRTAWREGMELGRHKYGQVVTDPPTPAGATDPVGTESAVSDRCARCGRTGSDNHPLIPRSDGTSACAPCHYSRCVKCEKNFAADGDVACPECRAWQDERNKQAPPLPRPRPHLVSVPNPIPNLIGPPATRQKENTMTIQTITGGEVNSPEQLVAELQAITAEAAADLEDARGDAVRAEEDAARIEKMVGCLTNLKLPPEDISSVQGLLEPAMARKAAAEQRAAAAEKRASQAQSALVMAQRHVELQGQGAAGDFYRS
jgi:hypothetical protein